MRQTTQMMTWQGREIATVSDIMQAMESCPSPEDALDFMDAYRAYLVGIGRPADMAEFNVGYTVGYFPQEEWKRLNAWFGVQHPLFGDVPPTPDEALLLGVRAAKEWLNGKMQPGALERVTYFKPAFDKRSDNAAEDYGVGSVVMFLVVKGVFGAVSFTVHTGWMLPHIEAEWKARGVYNALPIVTPDVIGIHSLAAREGWRRGDKPCDWLNGSHCYLQSLDYFQSHPLWKIMLTEGSEGVWLYMENLYQEYFRPDASGGSNDTQA